MTILHGKSWQMLRCSLCALPITNRLRFILVTTTSTNGRSAAPCQRGVVSRIGSFFYSNTFGILPSTISPWCVYCISAYIYIYIIFYINILHFEVLASGWPWKPSGSRVLRSAHAGRESEAAMNTAGWRMLVVSITFGIQFNPPWEWFI